MIQVQLKRFLWVVLGLFFLVPHAWAESFTVQGIDVVGLVSVKKPMVINSIPVHVGEHFTDSDSSALIKAIYALGYFKDVKVSQRGSHLVITVSERPLIDKFSLSGNSSIDNKNIKPILTKMNLEVGEFYDPSKINELSEGLKQQYNMLGRYAVDIDAKVKTLPGNRVSLNITINEGPIAKIHNITINGAHSFSQKELLKAFKLSPTTWLSFFTEKDRYSEFALSQDLQNLQSFYFDRGYLKYHVVSKDIDISKDNKQVDITLTVDEGKVYHVRKIELDESLKKISNIQSLIKVKVGDVFSRSKVINTTHAIGDYYSDQGYAFPDVHVSPDLDDKTQSVDLNFFAESGSKSYVRNINFIGNDRTADYVLRLRMQQMESSLFSMEKINVSKRKLALLPYFKNVNVKTEKVEGHPDQVDLEYSVDEVKAGAAQVQVGYSDVDGLLYGASISEPNFMGKGKYVSIGFQRSADWEQYNYTYNNPYCTLDGIGCGYNLNYTHYKGDDDYLESYTEDKYGASMSYSIPVSQNNMVNVGYGYSHIDIGNVIGNDSISPTVYDFVTKYPSPYDEFSLTAGWSYDGRDRAVFPTKGILQSLSFDVVPPAVLSTTVGYFTAKYNAQLYIPFHHGFILSPHTSLGYGDGLGRADELPFFENFFAGGIATLPGYSANSLGPHYNYTYKSSGASATSYLGGNLELLGGVNVIFPNSFSDNVRTAFILNAGNVFQTRDIAQTNANDNVEGEVSDESVALRNIRMTAGIMVEWHTFQPLSFSLAAPVLNKKSSDDTSIFGFNISTII